MSTPKKAVIVVIIRVLKHCKDGFLLDKQQAR
jgi:hypothetical protein